MEKQKTFPESKKEREKIMKKNKKLEKNKREEDKRNLAKKGNQYHCIQ